MVRTVARIVGVMLISGSPFIAGCQTSPSRDKDSLQESTMDTSQWVALAEPYDAFNIVAIDGIRISQQKETRAPSFVCPRRCGQSIVNEVSYADCKRVPDCRLGPGPHQISVSFGWGVPSTGNSRAFHKYMENDFAVDICWSQAFLACPLALGISALVKQGNAAMAKPNAPRPEIKPSKYDRTCVGTIGLDVSAGATYTLASDYYGNQQRPSELRVVESGTEQIVASAMCR